jgi:hypothetical protein
MATPPVYQDMADYRRMARSAISTAIATVAGTLGDAGGFLF